MLSTVQSLKPGTPICFTLLLVEPYKSSNFGEVYELEKGGTRIWFQPNKIILGNFNDEWEVEEEYNISRVPNEGYQLDEFEKLDSHIVPLPEAEELSKDYFSNT